MEERYEEIKKMVATLDDFHKMELYHSLSLTKDSIIDHIDRSLMKNHCSIASVTNELDDFEFKISLPSEFEPELGPEYSLERDTKCINVRLSYEAQSWLLSIRSRSKQYCYQVIPFHMLNDVVERLKYLREEPLDLDDFVEWITNL